MKILQAASKAIGALRTAGVVEKRAGLYVSRPLDPLNARKWHDWAVKYGVPNPIPAEELHVTVLYSPDNDVKLPMAELPVVICTQGCYQGGAFAMFGVNDDVLVYAFRSYELQDRHYQFLDAGAVSTWPTYRPHLSLSMDAAGFELPDAALQDVPQYIVLGPEVNAEPKKKAPDEEGQDGDEEGDEDIVIVIAVAASAAQAHLDAHGDSLNALDAAALYDVAKGRAVTRGVAKRLAAIDGAPEEVKALATSSAKSSERVRKQADVVVKVSSLPAEITKTLKSKHFAKSRDDEQIVMGIASVSTINGELVKDLHGDFVTTQALREFNRSIISGTRAGKFDHEGDAVTEIVGGIVLDEDWQKALDINLGYEPYLVEIRVPGADDWAEVKTGDWMLSIAGTMWYYEDADA